MFNQFWEKKFVKNFRKFFFEKSEKWNGKWKSGIWKKNFESFEKKVKNGMKNGKVEFGKNFWKVMEKKFGKVLKRK